jgi:phosphatidylglycerol:prolipoprotein diacylglycerol transferase
LVIAVSIAYAIFFDLPIFQTLMILTISISFTGFFGRLGCYNAGCCHGQRCKKGIIYPETYKQYELKEKYLNTPLFPTQFLESGWHLFNAFLGIFLMIINVPEEIIFYTVLLSYSLVRSLLEFKRGDERPTWIGVSEAQWTGALISILLLIITLGFTSFNLLVVIVAITHGFMVLFAASRNQWLLYKTNKMKRNNLNPV